MTVGTSDRLHFIKPTWPQFRSLMRYCALALNIPGLRLTGGLVTQWSFSLEFLFFSFSSSPGRKTLLALGLWVRDAGVE